MLFSGLFELQKETWDHELDEMRKKSRFLCRWFLAKQSCDFDKDTQKKTRLLNFQRIFSIEKQQASKATYLPQPKPGLFTKWSAPHCHISRLPDSSQIVASASNDLIGGSSHDGRKLLINNHG